MYPSFGDTDRMGGGSMGSGIKGVRVDCSADGNRQSGMGNRGNGEWGGRLPIPVSIAIDSDPSDPSFIPTTQGEAAGLVAQIEWWSVPRTLHAHEAENCNTRPFTCVRGIGNGGISWRRHGLLVRLDRTSDRVLASIGRPDHIARSGWDAIQRSRSINRDILRYAS